MEFKATKAMSRSQYNKKYLSQKMRVNHRSLELDALHYARLRKNKIQKLSTSRYGRIHRPVIRRVNINDIRWFDDVGYTLTYCIYDKLKYQALPQEVTAVTWPEIYQAYCEAVKLQLEQGIIK